MRCVQLLVGDPNQHIYSFNGCVNALGQTRSPMMAVGAPPGAGGHPNLLVRACNADDALHAGSVCSPKNLPVLLQPPPWS